ncbi:MAG: hypothetical protein K1X51_12360 [Rhodospirillaceae bacterium]|nr:hypothetical protein [Rhodospirillaceae bacterium]
MRPFIAAAALLAAGAAIAPAAWAAAPNDIIWDTPAPKSGAPKDDAVSKATVTPPAGAAESRQGNSSGQPDKNGIIWDTPAPSAATPDKSGITWNAPPVKPASTAPAGALPTPPSATTAATSAATGGPCREFQTTIVIDGQQQPAHGTVCRQPDGTWRLVNK